MASTQSWLDDSIFESVIIPINPVKYWVMDPNDELPRENPIDESWSISQIASRFPPRTWESLFESSMAMFQLIDSVLQERESYPDHGPSFPRRRNIFRAYELTPLHKVKVILVGQDPYPQTLPNGEPRAQGLSFSVDPSDTIPSSLQNIYKELSNTVPNFRIPDHGDLTSWARQGVLLLNISLTLQSGCPNSHRNIWKGFLMNTLNFIGSKRPNAVYVLLGKESQSVIRYLHNRAKVIRGVHPSGLSAHRGFLGSNIFNCINDHLISVGDQPIDWTIPLHRTDN